MAYNAEGLDSVIILDDEDDFCYTAFPSRFRHASIYLAQFQVSFSLQHQWRVRSRNAKIINNLGKGHCIYLSKFCIAIRLQRRWRSIGICSQLFDEELDSLTFLHNIVVCIQRVVKDQWRKPSKISPFHWTKISPQF
jgi:hypothetical protein